MKIRKIAYVYPTFDECVRHQILPPLGEFAKDFDVSEIAKKLICFDDCVQNAITGDLTSGFSAAVSAEEFWETAFNHLLNTNTKIEKTYPLASSWQKMQHEAGK